VSGDPDRVAVPTNGRRPHAVPPAPEAAGTLDAGADTGAGAGSRAESSGAPSAAELATAMSPRQLAIGFGILASLGLLLAGRLLRRRSGR
jgi:hypothetical protein